MSALAPEPTFYRVCLLCRREITVPWGPEAASTSGFLLREHLREHDASELLAYIFAEHGVTAESFYTAVPPYFKSAEGAARTTPSITPKPRSLMEGKRACDE